MQLYEAQEIVRRACQWLVAGGGVALMALGCLRWFDPPRGRKRRREAVIIGFLAQGRGAEALCCPIVDLGEGGTLRPVAVRTMKRRWRQQVGDEIPVCYRPNDFSSAVFDERRGRTGFALLQILGGAAAVLGACLGLFA